MRRFFPVFSFLAFFGLFLFSLITSSPVNAAGDAQLVHNMANCFDAGLDLCRSYGPYQEPILYNGKLYGTTTSSGYIPGGSIYRVNLDFTGFTVLHAFDYEGGDGYNAYGRLLNVGGVFYGMSGNGGASSQGTIYKINPDGTGYAIIHTFTGQPAGGNPQGSLIEYNGKLYGMTVAGGTNNKGTVFSINTDGTGYQTLKSFTGGADGAFPAYYGYLTVYNDTLYGMTAQDGSSFGGVMFKLNPDGTGYTVLYNLNSTSGNSPFSGFINIGGTFYATMSSGGSSGKGTVMKIQPDGTGLTVLHNFTGGGAGGQAPYGSLLASGGKLFGTTYQGGDANSGTVFSINEDGTGFTLLYEFSESINNGKLPRSGFTLDSGKLYGTTYSSYNGGPGSVFSITTDGSISAHLTIPLTRARNLQGDLTPYNGKLFGTAATGGKYVRGAVFSINPDGTSPTILHEFPSSATDGYTIYGTLVEAGGDLYGMTNAGGTSGGGTIFKINPTGSTYSVIHNFTCSGSDGCNPNYGALLYYGGELYGTTTYGGTSGSGVLFKIGLDGSGYTALHSFAAGVADGSQPYNAGLAVYNGQLFGFTERGGDNNRGTVYKINPDGTGFTLLYEFTGGVDGRWPESAPTLIGDTLYGTTNGGGANAEGALFSIKVDGTGFTVLHDFSSADIANGSTPFGGVVHYGGVLYGTTQYGGTNGQGTVYEIKPDGTNFALRHSFERNSTDIGGGPLSTPIVYDAQLWFTVQNDVTGQSLGAIYKMALPDIIPPIISGITPTDDSTISSSTPIVEFTLNENGSCRASLVDESYDDMSTDIDCGGDGTTSISCSIPDLGADGLKTLYFACSDTLNNKDTIDSNATVTYTLLLPTPTPTPSPTATPTSTGFASGSFQDTSEDTSTPEPTPTPLVLDLKISKDTETNSLVVKWNSVDDETVVCNLLITDATGAPQFEKNNLICSQPLTITQTELSILTQGSQYTLTLTLIDIASGSVLGTETAMFTYSGQSILLTPTVTAKPSGSYPLTWLWWTLAIVITCGTVVYTMSMRRKPGTS